MKVHKLTRQRANEPTGYQAKKLMNGIAALPVLLLTAAIILEIGVVSIVLANVFNNSRYNDRLATEAFSAARAGAQDAALRVIRYKVCPATPGCPGDYTITVGSRSAEVTIAASGDGIITVNSIGTAVGRQKKVQVILFVDSFTGEVSLRSFKEVAL